MAALQEYEASLSKARLQLLDKRKEVREAVHQHYGDLIGVGDHAVKMSENCDEISRCFSRVFDLNRLLGMRSGSFGVSSTSLIVSGIPDVGGSGRTLTSALYRMNNLMSMNGRAYFHARKHEYGEIRKMLVEEFDGLSDSVRLSTLNSSSVHSVFIDTKNHLRARINELCKRGFSNPNIVSLSNLLDCLQLYKETWSNSTEMKNYKSDYWNGRSELLQRLGTIAVRSDGSAKSPSESISVLLKHYELSLEVAVMSGSRDGSLGDDIFHSTFVNQFGDPTQGLLCVCIFTILHEMNSLSEVIGEYHDVMKTMEEWRRVQQFTAAAGISTLLQQSVRQVVDLIIQRTVAELDVFQLTTIGGNNNEWCLDRTCSVVAELVHSVRSIPFMNGEQSVGIEFNKRILATCYEIEMELESDSGGDSYCFQVGSRSGMLLSTITGNSMSSNCTRVPIVGDISHLAFIEKDIFGLSSNSGGIEPAVTVSTLFTHLHQGVKKLETLVALSFNKFWALKLTTATKTGWLSADIGGQLQSSKSDHQIITLIPTSPSSSVWRIVFDIARVIDSVPFSVQPLARKSVKQFLVSRVISEFKTMKSGDTPPLFSTQMLFNLHYLVIILSDLFSNDEYDTLSNVVLESVEKAILTDTVDWLTYKEVFRQNAFYAVQSSSLLINTLIGSNPLYSYLKETSEKNQNSERFVESSTSLLPLIAARFETLPLVRTNPAADINSKAPLVGKKQTVPNPAQNSMLNAANSVTSFFNQMGSKITLGNSSSAPRK